MHAVDRPQPGFLGIGAARAGTSWLYRHLRRHPELWLPPLKELHYFDAQRPGAADYYPVEGVDVARLARQWRWSHAASLARRALLFRGQLGWSLRYLAGRRSDAWYASLFRGDRLSGEITPGYMLLPEAAVSQVRQFNPALKVMLILRNPIERAWSSARRKLAGRGDLAEEALLAELDSPGVVRRGDYVGAINAWRNVFGREQLWIGFYDDLVERPRELLRSLLAFLAVDASDRSIPNDLSDAVNTSPPRPLPPRIARRLAETYLKQLRQLDDQLGSHASHWLAEAERALSQSRAPTS